MSANIGVCMSRRRRRTEAEDHRQGADATKPVGGNEVHRVLDSVCTAAGWDGEVLSLAATPGGSRHVVLGRFTGLIRDRSKKSASP